MVQSDFATSIRTTLRDATKLKSIMIKRKITAARVPCPECGGMIHGRLAGHRNYMRFWCDGSCKRSMME